MEIDWGGKFIYTSCGYPMANWQGHETHPTGHKTSEVDWGGHDPNPNHVNESLISEVDWGAHNPDADDPEQLTGESIQSFLTLVVQLQWLVALGRLVTYAQVTTLFKLVTEVCYLLEVSWQMCHAWITHWTVARAILTMSRRRSTRNERTHGRDAREPLLAHT